MAYAIQLEYPELARNCLAETRQLKHSPVALLIRAIDRSTQSVHDQDCELARKALLDLEYVRFLMPENQSALAWESHTLAFLIHKERLQTGTFSSLDIQGRALAEQLVGDQANVAISSMSWQLLTALGQEEEASQAIRQTETRKWHAWQLAADCIRRYESPTTAHNAFRSARDKLEVDKHTKLAEAILIHDIESERHRIKGLVEEAVEDSDPVTRLFALCTQCLSGDTLEVAQ